MKVPIFIGEILDKEIGNLHFEEHLNNLNVVINRLSDANLKLKANKCNFSAKKFRSLNTLYYQKKLKQTHLKLKQWMTESVLQINLNYGVFKDWCHSISQRKLRNGNGLQRLTWHFNVSSIN